MLKPLYRVSQYKLYTLITACYFHVELKIISDFTYIGRITSASFDTLFVGKIAIVDCPSLKAWSYNVAPCSK